MDFKQINCFLEVALCKSFTDAAAKLFISQPAISRQIANMEAEIGAPLLYRNRRSIELTPAGEIMLAAFREITSIYDTARSNARRNTTRNEPFRLGMAHFIPFCILPDQVKGLVSTDSITVEYASHPELNTLLHGGEYHAIVTLKKSVENAPGISYRSLCRVPIVLIYPQKFLKGKEEQGLAALSGLDFYIPDSAYIPGALEDMKSVCEKMNIQPRSIKSVNNTNTMFLVAETGQGVTFLDDFARRNLQSTELVFFPTHLYHEFVFAYINNERHPLLHEMLDSIFLSEA